MNENKTRYRTYTEEFKFEAPSSGWMGYSLAAHFTNWVLSVKVAQ